MGNIFAKHKKDTDTALQYYNQALTANPDDYITLTNIGTQLAKLGKLTEAKTFLNKALTKKPTYTNAHLSLAMVYDVEQSYLACFDTCVACLKQTHKKDAVYKSATHLLHTTAKKLIDDADTDAVLTSYQKQLETASGKPIKIEENNSLATAAKIELAEYYDRDYHLVKYKPDHANKEHLIMHELVHLDFVTQARQTKVNKKYTTNDSAYLRFQKDIAPTVALLLKTGLSPQAKGRYTQALFDGINSQIYNTPIDLFIEDFLYCTFPTLRAHQFLSIRTILHQGIEAVTRNDIVELSPPSILSVSKTYNLVLAMQYRDLYGIDLVPELQASKQETTLATSFYEEYMEYKDDKAPGEEYEILEHWAEDLRVDGYFKLVEEVRIPLDDDIEDLLTSIEQDPHELDTPDAAKEAKMAEFQKAAKEAGTNFAVVMYMVEALRYYRDMPLEEVKKTAFEIAMQGTQGYSPEGKSYRISAMPNKKFSGYHILAYYYVSWSIAMPHAVSELGLDYAAEYDLAQKIGKI